MALEVPAVVEAKSSRRPADQVAAEVLSHVPRMCDGAAKSTTAVETPRDSPVTAGGERRSSIVTARRPKAAVSLPPGLLADTPEEHRRRGDAADALFRDLVQRITEKP